MATDRLAVAEFYATSRGAVAARLLRHQLGELWPAGEIRGCSVLGYGYAAPYLRPWREASARCVNATPIRIGARPWPAGAPGRSCITDDESLPFPDLGFDRILLVHGLEVADHARRLLREIWRVLKDDGRLIVIAPNRRGLWAQVETTPFGHGQPYSPSQLGRLLALSLFRVERRLGALYLPPVQARLVLRSAPLWEHAGERLLPHCAGVLLAEAVKDVYAAVPRHPAPRRRVILAEPA